jgi:hypothetical protein
MVWLDVVCRTRGSIRAPESIGHRYSCATCFRSARFQRISLPGESETNRHPVVPQEDLAPLVVRVAQPSRLGEAHHALVQLSTALDVDDGEPEMVDAPKVHESKVE